MHRVLPVVGKGVLDLLDHKDLEVIQGLWDLKAWTDSLEIQDREDLLGRLEDRASTAGQDLKVHQVKKVKKESRVQLGSRELMDLEVIPDQLELQAREVYPAKKEFR